MRWPFALACGSGCALVLFAVAGARADTIAYTFDWSPGQPAVAADSPGTGGVSFTDTLPHSVLGPTNSVPTSLSTFTTAHFSNPDHFTNTPYSLSVAITDGAHTGSLTWTGDLNGTLSLESTNITNTFISPVTQTLNLNGHTYTITLGPFVAPGIPSAINKGSIGAFINVQGGSSDGSGGNNGGGTNGGKPPTGSTPEPSTALLSCLGASFLGLAAWKKWRQTRRT